MAKLKGAKTPIMVGTLAIVAFISLYAGSLISIQPENSYACYSRGLVTDCNDDPQLSSTNITCYRTDLECPEGWIEYSIDGFYECVSTDTITDCNKGVVGKTCSRGNLRCTEGWTPITNVMNLSVVPPTVTPQTPPEEPAQPTPPTEPTPGATTSGTVKHVKTYTYTSTADITCKEGEVIFGCECYEKDIELDWVVTNKGEYIKNVFSPSENKTVKVTVKTAKYKGRIRTFNLVDVTETVTEGNETTVNVLGKGEVNVCEHSISGYETIEYAPGENLMLLIGSKLDEAIEESLASQPTPEVKPLPESEHSKVKSV